MRSRTCPDETLVAGYVDGGLDEAMRQELERHLADCDHCLAVVGLLSRERHASVAQAVSSPVLTQAHGRPTKVPPRIWRSVSQWAAAAALVLAVPLLLQVGRGPDAGHGGDGRPAPPATRTIAPQVDTLQVIVPLPGSAVDAKHVQFRWTDVAGSPYYDVRIVTDDGAVVVRERVTGTAWQLPEQLQLLRGAEYFVHVDAYPSGDKPLSSGHLPFRIAE